MGLLDSPNKTFCKSCIFHPDYSKRLQLPVSRMEEITTYFWNALGPYYIDLTLIQYKPEYPKLAVLPRTDTYTLWEYQEVRRYTCQEWLEHEFGNAYFGIKKFKFWHEQLIGNTEIRL